MRHDGVGPYARFAIPCAVSLVLVASVWFGSLSHHRGLVRYDSNYYLRQAAFFVESLGVDSWGHVEPKPFTTVWPLGYPFSIAVAAHLTGLPVFWAAKIVNCGAALLCILLLLRTLPQTGTTACLAFLSAGMVTTFSSTFAEGIFILALLVAALSLARVLERSSRYAALVLATAVAAAFSIRYVGVVLIGPVLAACVWAYLQGRRRAARLLAGALVGATALIGACLSFNQWVGGFLLPPRQPRQESVLMFAYETTKAFLSEANFVFLYVPNPRNPVLLAAFGAILVLTLAVGVQFWIRARRAEWGLGQLSGGERLTIVVLAFTGVFFWAAMVVMRFRIHFNPLDFRYLGPGTVLVTAAALSVLAALGLGENRRARTSIALIVLASVAYAGVYGPLQSYREQPVLFTERMEDILTRYRHVPSDSVVLRGSLHLLFLRPDLLVVPEENIRGSQGMVDLLRDQASRAGRPVWLEHDGRPTLIEPPKQ